MKIGIISLLPRLPWAGSEELWAQMASAALEERHEVAISMLHHAKPRPKLDALEKQGAQVLPRWRRRVPSANSALAMILRRPVPWPPPRPLYSYKAIFDFKPDVVCISQGSTYDFIGDPDLQEHLARSKVPFTVVCQANDEGPLDESLREEATSFFRAARHVAFVSQGNMQVARRQLAHTIPNAIVVQNPVNLSDFRAVPWPEEEEVQWACVARVDNLTKGQDVLFEALGRPQWSDRSWRLRLYGEGPDVAHLRDLSHLHGFAERIELCGQVADVRNIWARHHMLLLTSRKEGTPLALIEALLCGRPALVTDVAGNAEWVEEGRTGFVAPAPTTPLIEDALERAWNSKSQWKEMGQRAHESASTRFDRHAGRSLLRLLTKGTAPDPGF